MKIPSCKVIISTYYFGYIEISHILPGSYCIKPQQVDVKVLSRVAIADITQVWAGIWILRPNAEDSNYIPDRQ